MPDTFYCVHDYMILTCNEDMIATPDSLIIVGDGVPPDSKKVRAMLYRANTQPGLLEACKAVDKHGEVGNTDNEVVIPSDIFDLISKAIAAAGETP